MNPAGHLAVGALLASKRRAVEPVMIGTFLPDLIDKPLMWGGVTPYGRTVGHSLLLWCTVALFAGVAGARRFPREAALRAFLLGGWAHLCADFVDDAFAGFERGGYAFTAWAGWPWTNPDMWAWRVPHLLPADSHATSAFELVVLVGCALVLVRRRLQ